MISLRPYQQELIDKTRQEMQLGHRAVLIQSPTGSGKTLLTAQMLRTAAQKGMPSLFVCHRRELILQSSKAFTELNISHSVIASGFHYSNRQMVNIASIQTLRNRIKYINKPKLIVLDEVHHIAAKSWEEVYYAFPDAFIIGLTATPERLDGTGLIKYFQTMINGPTVQWLIDNGFLCKYKLFAPKSIDISKIHTKMGDFVASELSAAIDKPTITGDAIKEYTRLAKGKRAIVRGVSIKHSEHIAEQFNNAGIPALHVDGKTPKEDRDEAMESFRRGETLVLSNVDLFGEGLDVPSVECVIDLRPTQSLTLWLQFCGRVLRMFPGKEWAIIIDHAGNVARHGLPCDERTWSLLGREKKKKDEGAKIKLCPECFAALQNWRMECVYCKYVFPRVGAREIEEVEGELKEVDLERIKIERKKEQGMAKSYEDLVELGRSRGYKSPDKWARFVFENRKKKNHGDW